jgi:hypothetical protein
LIFGSRSGLGSVFGLNVGFWSVSVSVSGLKKVVGFSRVYLKAFFFLDYLLVKQLYIWCSLSNKNNVSAKLKRKTAKCAFPPSHMS